MKSTEQVILDILGKETCLPTSKVVEKVLRENSGRKREEVLQCLTQLQVQEFLLRHSLEYELLGCHGHLCRICGPVLDTFPASLGSPASASRYPLTILFTRPQPPQSNCQ